MQLLLPGFRKIPKPEEDIYLNGELIGYIEIVTLDSDVIDFKSDRFNVAVLPLGECEYLSEFTLGYNDWNEYKMYWNVKI